MLCVVCCDRGAPGATTTALALGAATSGASFVVEADPYGGDLGVRCQARDGGRLPETPTVLTALTAARTETSGDVIPRYTHPITDSVGVLPGYLSAEQGAAVTDWAPLARVMQSTGGSVFCDIGRIHSQSPSVPIAAAADVVVVVSRADVGAIIHLRERLARLVGVLAEQRGTPPLVVPVLIAPKRQAPGLVTQLLGMLADSPVGSVVDQAGWVAWDPSGVARLEAGDPAPKSPLMRSATTVAHLVAEMGTRQATHPAQTPAGVRHLGGGR